MTIEGTAVKNILIVGMIIIWATAAIAHSPLKSTIPADEAIISEVPTEVLLDFKGDIRLTRVTIKHADNDAIKMDISGHDGFIKNYIIPIENTSFGIYVIDWRGLGADGHALNGKFSFMVE